MATTIPIECPTCGMKTPVTVTDFTTGVFSTACDGCGETVAIKVDTNHVRMVVEQLTLAQLRDLRGVLDAKADLEQVLQKINDRAPPAADLISEALQSPGGKAAGRATVWVLKVVIEAAIKALVGDWLSKGS